MNPSADASFEHVLTAARAGDRQAVGRLLEECRAYLLAVANREWNTDLQAKAGASDLVGDTCLLAVDRFPAFQGRTLAELRAWLRSILRHRMADVRDHYATIAAAVNREVPIQPPDSSAGLLDILTLNAPGPESLAMRAERLDALRQAITRLSPEYLAVIRLRYEQHHSFEEIGRQTERSADAARMLHNRAIAALRKALGEKS